MKVKVNIVMGMIGSGKTTFINSLLNNIQLDKEKICIIQLENGQINIDCEKRQNRIIPIKVNSNETFDGATVISIISRYNPDRIFIECNCMSNPENIINIFSDSKIKEICNVDKVICTTDAKSIKMYILNMANIINSQILNADIIVINKTQGMSRKEVKDIRKNISLINGIAKFVEYENLSNLRKSLQDKEVSITNDTRMFNGNKVFNTLVTIISIGIILIVAGLIPKFQYVSLPVHIDAAIIKQFNTKFMGILIETIPFILLGSFVSSIIQVFISSDRISKIFPKNRFISCIIASVAGILFPVCDCGTIPVARGLIRKGIPVSTIVTFMLAAPIVNPIAIMSTVYAFPGMRSIVIYRIILGVIVAISVGLVMGCSKSKNIFTNNIVLCNCGVCEDSYNSSTKLISKMKTVFIHAGDEFFNVGKFMIIGAFLSSAIQTGISLNKLTLNSEGVAFSLGIIIVFALIFSVCSTSDAFIAKGFINQFPINSVIGFLVLGPMINIKNIMMLFGSFKKLFVLKLITVIIAISFILLINIPL